MKKTKKMGKAAPPPHPKSKRARLVSRIPVPLPSSDKWAHVNTSVMNHVWLLGSFEKPLLSRYPSPHPSHFPVTLKCGIQRTSFHTHRQNAQTNPSYLSLSPKALNLLLLLPFNGSFSFLCSFFSHHLLCSPSPPSASKSHCSFSHSLFSQLYPQPLFQAIRRGRLLVPSNPFSIQTLPRSLPAFWCCLQLCAGRFGSWLRRPDCPLHRIHRREGELILPI